MTIEKNLPFTFCDNCPEFILNVKEETVYVGSVAGSTTVRVISVRCKNEWLCKQLEAHRKEQFENGQSM